MITPTRLSRLSRHLPAAIITLAICAAAVQVFAAQAPIAQNQVSSASVVQPANRVALVLSDSASLRASARDSSPAQAQMIRGEAVEIRAERLDWYQVWDYRRERGGFLRRSQVLMVANDTSTLLAQLRVVLPQDNTEGLALGLAAAYVQAATSQELAGPAGVEVLDAIGQIGQRIASNTGTKRAGLLDVATRYGIRFANYQQADGSLRVCDEGDAYRRVLSMPGAASPKVRAALALTRPECRSTSLTPSQTAAQDDWRAEVLSHAPVDGLAGFERNRLLMRRASVGASRAFSKQDTAIAKVALEDFSNVEPAELPEDDRPEYNDTAMRLNAMRWLAAQATTDRSFAQGIRMTLTAGEGPGEHCMNLIGAKGQTLVRKCTMAQVFLSSAQMNRESNAIAVAVQPLDGWRELWVLRSGKTEWTVDVLPPAAATPGLGYVEFAGWVPGGKQLLVASESRAEGKYASTRFAQLDLATLTPQRTAFEANQLGSFQRWGDAEWKAGSLANR